MLGRTDKNFILLHRVRDEDDHSFRKVKPILINRNLIESVELVSHGIGKASGRLEATTIIETATQEIYVTETFSVIQEMMKTK